MKTCLFFLLAVVISNANAFADEPSGLLDLEFGIKQVATNCRFTEGPIVDRDHNLYFSDGPNNRILKVTPDQVMTVFAKPCGAANGLLFDLQGRILMCQSARPGGARAVARIESDGSITTLANRYGGKKFIAPNDLCIDAAGNVFFTDPYYDGEKSQPNSGVYRLDPKGKVTLLEDRLWKPNGIVITPDDRFVYVSDRGNQKLYRYRLTPQKTLADQTQIYDFSPDRGIDGMWLDVRGNIYGAAGQGDTTGLFVISPKGERLLHKPMPEFSTNVTFGGPDMKDLYITATTSVYRLRTTIPGVQHRYARK